MPDEPTVTKHAGFTQIDQRQVPFLLTREEVEHVTKELDQLKRRVTELEAENRRLLDRMATHGISGG